MQYWQYLRQDLGLAEESFAGQGSGGETVAEGLLRLEDLFDRDIYPNAEVLLFWQGGGDVLRFIREYDPLVVQSPDDSAYPFRSDLDTVLDQVQVDIEQVIALAKAQNLRTYVATYYDLVSGPCKPAMLNLLLPDQARRANQYVHLLNERIRSAADNQDAILVDVAEQAPDLADDPANYADCNHLSNQGNRVVADVFLRAIQATQ